jgi:hypothetical protein
MTRLYYLILRIYNIEHRDLNYLLELRYIHKRSNAHNRCMYAEDRIEERLYTRKKARSQLTR